MNKYAVFISEYADEKGNPTQKIHIWNENKYLWIYEMV